MNPIIGTLVNGENNITTNQIKVFVQFQDYIWQLGKTSKIFIRFSVQRENSAKEGEKLSLKRPSISGLFPIFKKSARVGVIQLTLSMDIIQYLAYKKATKSEATQKSLTPKITATNSMCIFANLSTIGFRLSCKDWSLIAIL